MKKTILTSALFLCCIFNYAQNYYFEGVVIDEQLSTPVQGAIVTIEGTKFTEGTDSNGKFIFRQKLPDGQHGVIVEKKDFDTKIFLVDVIPNTKIEAAEIKLAPNKKEIYRRKKASKKEKKQNRITEKKEAERISDIEKELRKKDKAYAKELKRLEKRKRKGKVDDDDVVVNYEDNNTSIKSQPSVTEQVVTITEVQRKYGQILGVEPADLTNVELYELIDEWDNVSYEYGGVTKRGIDCSSFTQLIYTSVYNHRLERTADAQFNSELNDEFKNKDQIYEGDLVFFTGVGSDNNVINHVGVYLHNNMFVHSTSNLDNQGKGGVQISSLNDKYWSTKFLAAGRQIIER